MPNNVINKVVYGDRTLIDLTDTTATAETILSGYGAYGADGVWVDGTATAGSLSGHVWQDNEGYIHLDDDGGDMYITTPLNVTENGTYTAPTGVAYTPVSVQVPQSIDLPVLTIHFDSNYDIDSVTCNKTYAECVSLSIDDIVDAIVQFDWDGSLQESTYGATGAYDSYSSLIRFNVADVNYSYCSYVITYNSNNTLSIVAHNTKDSGNMTASGATVTAEAGYYPYASSKSVASGSAGTPTATKGTVSNHAVTVTPSVTNTTGYITGGTKTGTAVTVSASDLVSGTLSITSSGTKDVTNYASASIASGSATASATKGTVSNHSITVTPSVTRTAGYITAGTASGTAVTVSASELASGNKAITQNGDNIDVVGYSTVSVNVSGGATYTATITGTPSETSAFVRYNNTYYYTVGDEITFSAGDTMTLSAMGVRYGGDVSIDGTVVVSDPDNGVSYNYTLPSHDIIIDCVSGSTAHLYVTFPTISITQNGKTNVNGYYYADVNVSGGGGAEQKQINFIDYDGTIVASYTASEWANVTTLPSNPSHTGLVAQGWNWTKSEIDAQLTAVPDGDVWVGQQYVTSSGDTEIEVEFDDPYNLSPNFTCAVNGSIRIDWGDGSATTSVINSSLTSYVHNSHTYSSVGKYTIVIHILSGSWAICGNSMAFLNASLSGSSFYNSVYSTCVKRIRFGNNTYLGSYAFYGCLALESITMPSSTGFNDVGLRNSFYYCLSLVSLTLPRGLTIIGDSGLRAARGLRSLSLPATFDILDHYSFYECEVLKSITIPYTVTALLASDCFASCRCLEKIALPNTITTIYNNTFRDCYSLRSVKLGNSVTSIGSSSGSSYAFGLCYSLGSITLPSTVTDIKNYSFYSLYNLKELHMLGTTPPTLGTNNFNNLAIDYRIYVPYSADHSVLEAYQTAANWSSHSIHMVEESP